MKNYKGIIKGYDEPRGGGSYVSETLDAHEKFNFETVYLSDQNGYTEGDYCLGFVETKSTNKKNSNQLNIEKIEGCESLKGEQEADDILVVYCALYPDSIQKETYIVGWYKHATVYRNYNSIILNRENTEYTQLYNAIAKKEDCVLLPVPNRRKPIWEVHRKKGKIAYGFGQSNVWYAQGAEENPLLKQFLNRISDQINSYDGDNLINQ